MARIVMVGAGVVGLSTAMLLAADGHEVTVVERDPESPPSPTEAWDRWERRGVNQFRMLHYFQPRFRAEIESELPALARAFDAAGALRLNVVDLVPEELSGGRREGDDAFEALTGRRPVIESVLASVAEETPGVTIRRGAVVRGLVVGTEAAAGIPHVTGLCLEDGEKLTGDLVVDVSGRRSPLISWLTAVGARAPIEEAEDSGFVYYGRHFRSADGSIPPMIGPFLQNAGSVSILTLPADNGTWGIGIIASAKDAPLRRLLDVDRWMAAVRSFPLAAHWTDGEPLDDGIALMAKIEDRYRAFVVDGRPVATGIAAVGDAWACTNPSVGRGATIGLLHGLALRDVLRKTGTDEPVRFAAAWDEATAATVEPWYRATLRFDRHRLAEIDATIAGETYEPEDPEWEMTRALMFASATNPDCLRGFLSVAGLLRSGDEVMSDPAVLEAVIGEGAGWRDAPLLGPSREELLAIAGA